MTTRHHYGELIEELKYSVVKMANLVQEATGKAMQAFAQRSDQLARQVKDEDHEIDAWETKIEAQCANLIGTQQPVAGDLRVIVAALSISNDLERMGDYAVHLATVATKFSKKIVVKARDEIASMSEIAISMVRDSAKAFLDQDPELAREVQKRDDQIDGLYARFFREVLTDMEEQRSQIQEATSMLFCSKYLERLADHATNICDEVIYVCTGRKYQDQ
ncbi:MAG: phosphate signaling complex protein PhoU [Spirochaetales bacterium]|nr:phosphate signaling complex protein PhoU [Spirochaetales bacterium]